MRWGTWWLYSLLLLLLIGAAAWFPSLFRTKRFQYTASELAAPSFPVFPLEQSLPTLEGNRLQGSKKLKDLIAAHPAGILVNFWATWCPPCLEELPSLEMLHRALAGKPDLPALIAVSVDEQPKDVFKLFATLRFHPTLPVFFDKGGSLAQKVGTNRFPETYWVNSEGKVLHKWLGPQDWLSEGIIRRLSANLLK